MNLFTAIVMYAAAYYWLGHRKSPANQITTAAASFTHGIRAAIGPDQLAQNCRDAYANDQITVEQYEEDLELIQKEFPGWNYGTR